MVISGWALEFKSSVINLFRSSRSRQVTIMGSMWAGVHRGSSCYENNVFCAEVQHCKDTRIFFHGKHTKEEAHGHEHTHTHKACEAQLRGWIRRIHTLNTCTTMIWLYMSGAYTLKWAIPIMHLLNTMSIYVVPARVCCWFHGRTHIKLVSLFITSGGWG